MCEYGSVLGEGTTVAGTSATRPDASSLMRLRGVPRRGAGAVAASAVRSGAADVDAGASARGGEARAKKLMESRCKTSKGPQKRGTE